MEFNLKKTRLSFVDTLDPSLVCPVCKQAFLDPVIVSGARTVCRSCAGPESEGKQLLEDSEKEQRLNALMVECVNRDKGCFWARARDKLELHLEKTCKYSTHKKGSTKSSSSLAAPVSSSSSPPSSSPPPLEPLTLSAVASAPSGATTPGSRSRSPSTNVILPSPVFSKATQEEMARLVEEIDALLVRKRGVESALRERAEKAEKEVLVLREEVELLRQQLRQSLEQSDAQKKKETREQEERARQQEVEQRRKEEDERRKKQEDDEKKRGEEEARKRKLEEDEKDSRRKREEEKKREEESRRKKLEADEKVAKQREEERKEEEEREKRRLLRAAEKRRGEEDEEKKRKEQEEAKRKSDDQQQQRKKEEEEVAERKRKEQEEAKQKAEEQHKKKEGTEEVVAVASKEPPLPARRKKPSLQSGESGSSLASLGEVEEVSAACSRAMLLVASEKLRGDSDLKSDMPLSNVAQARLLLLLRSGLLLGKTVARLYPGRFDPLCLRNKGGEGVFQQNLDKVWAAVGPSVLPPSLMTAVLEQTSSVTPGLVALLLVLRDAQAPRARSAARQWLPGGAADSWPLRSVLRVWALAVAEEQQQQHQSQQAAAGRDWEALGADAVPRPSSQVLAEVLLAGAERRPANLPPGATLLEVLRGGPMEGLLQGENEQLPEDAEEMLLLWAAAKMSQKSKLRSSVIKAAGSDTSWIDRTSKK